MRLFISAPWLLRLQWLLASNVHSLMAVAGISDDKWIIGRQMGAVRWQWHCSDQCPSPHVRLTIKMFIPEYLVLERTFKLHSDDKWLLLQIAMTYIHSPNPLPSPHYPGCRGSQLKCIPVFKYKYFSLVRVWTDSYWTSKWPQHLLC